MDDGVRWGEVEAGVPEFARRVRERFDAGVHKTLATLRSDGAPRLSGTELEISDAEVTLGMMAGSVKLADVLRDPRVALHSPSTDPDPADPSAWAGEAKMSGRLVPVEPPPETAAPPGSHFRLSITEVVLTAVGRPADHLVVESWHPAAGYRCRRRD